MAQVLCISSCTVYGLIHRIFRSTNTDNDIFNKALDAFVESLAPDERALFSSCSSAEQLLADVRRLDPISKDRARGRGFLKRITVFGEKLAPYFEVIGIIISSNPQYSAVVWGAIRLVLQVFMISSPR